MVPNYNYVVWFRDNTLKHDDENNEWPACFGITAADGHEAQAWGDQLARSYSRRNAGCEFLRSYLDTNSWQARAVPQVTVGEDAPDEVIGW